LPTCGLLLPGTSVFDDSSDTLTGGNDASLDERDWFFASLTSPLDTIIDLDAINGEKLNNEPWMRPLAVL
jgi:hypothetical protein